MDNQYRLAISLLISALAANSTYANSNETQPKPDTLHIPPAVFHSSLQWSGYGSFDIQTLDVYRNVQTESADTRARADAKKIVLIASKWLTPSTQFKAEIEYEHGGTGSAVEYEAEEFGEYELELESGGEVIVEQLFILLVGKDAVRNWRFGQFIVPVGSANIWHSPLNRFTVEPSQMEQSLIPVGWTAVGAELSGYKRSYRYQVQLINSLDSSLFSGYGYVSDGATQRQEFRLADNLAAVLRLEKSIFLESGSIGGSMFVGNTADNRPNQNVSGSALLKIFEAHARYQDERHTLRAQYLYSTLDNADGISEANQNTFGSGVLGISRTAIGSSAQGWSVEGAYNIAPLVFDDASNTRLDLFARVESFDSMDDTAGDVIDNPRYERSVNTAGLNYTHNSGTVFKAQYSHETNEGSSANQVDTLAFGVAFKF